MPLEIYVGEKSQLVVIKVGEYRLDLTTATAFGAKRDINDNGGLRAEYLSKRRPTNPSKPKRDISTVVCASRDAVCLEYRLITLLVSTVCSPQLIQ